MAKLLPRYGPVSTTTAEREMADADVKDSWHRCEAARQRDVADDILRRLGVKP